MCSILVGRRSILDGLLSRLRVGTDVIHIENRIENGAQRNIKENQQRKWLELYVFLLRQAL